MMAQSGPADARPPHVPVLLRPLLAAVAPVTGTWLDGDNAIGNPITSPSGTDGSAP